jgi:hypothetical protein
MAGQYVGNLWKSKLANGVQIHQFKLTAIHPEILDLTNVAELNLDKNMFDQPDIRNPKPSNPTSETRNPPN